MDLEVQSVMLEVFLDLFAVDVVDIQVRHRQDAAPTLVAFGELRVLLVEDTVEEGKVVGDLLVSVHVEAILGLNDRGVHV